jgi:hypothetical protein
MPDEHNGDDDGYMDDSAYNGEDRRRSREGRRVCIAVFLVFMRFWDFLVSIFRPSLASASVPEKR